MKFDLQDALLLVGIASIVGGVSCWSRPAAAIVFGVFCLAFVLTIGRAVKPGDRESEGKL